MTYRQKLKEAHRLKLKLARLQPPPTPSPAETVRNHLSDLPSDLLHIGTNRLDNCLTMRFSVVGANMYFDVDYWLLGPRPYIRIATEVFDIATEDFWNNTKVAAAIHDAIEWASLPRETRWGGL